MESTLWSEDTRGPLHTRDWEPVTITLQALSLVEEVEPVQVCSTLRLRDQQSMWIQDGCKIYMALNGSCFMVTWIIFQNHLLEVDLTQNRETTALRTLTTVGLFYFIMCKDSHEQKFIAIAIGSRPIHIALEGLWPHNMILEVCWDSLWTLSFGLSRFHSHGSWLVCEAALFF